MPENVKKGEMYKRLTIITAFVIVIIVTFHPERHAKYYTYIPTEDTIKQLVINLDNESNLKICDYENVIKNKQEISIYDISNVRNYVQPLGGGEYAPKTCSPLYKTAIIVPYRDRQEQLNIFLDYMHTFLQNQYIHYKIFIVEQKDNMPFNRGKLLNIGTRMAINAGYKCMILHDVDLIPLNSGNMYVCTKLPRHMSSCVDSFRFQVPYRELFGGAVALQLKHIAKINGLSNEYDGWGGEDDDLFRRLKSQNISTTRFSPELSRYTMLKHKKATPSPHRYKLLRYALERQSIDGLNNLESEYKTIEEPLFTRVLTE